MSCFTEEKIEEINKSRRQKVRYHENERHDIERLARSDIAEGIHDILIGNQSYWDEAKTFIRFKDGVFYHEESTVPHSTWSP